MAHGPTDTPTHIQEGIIASITDQDTAAAQNGAQDVDGSQLSDVLTITIGHASNDLYVAFLPPLLPLFIAQLGLSKTQAGLLSFIRQTPSFLQPAMGHLADRFNLRRVVILTPTITAAAFSLLSVAGEYATGIFFNVYLDAGLRVPTPQIGLLIGVAQLVSVPVAVGAPLLMARWGRFRTLLWGIVGVAISVLTATARPAPTPR